MTYATIDQLRESLAGATHQVMSPEYIAKMMHTVPEATVVDREKFILERCKGKRVLEFGASGRLQKAIFSGATFYIGVDRQESPELHIVGFDLDSVKEEELPSFAPGVQPPDVIVCGEIIEHLANPGYFLERLHAQFTGIPVVISVPNGTSAPAAVHLRDSIENVNKDHVAWYSWKTLNTLLTRYGYSIEGFHWYGGKPMISEGLIVVAR
jgi:2-polyprenyl-3-methyl-5-hydroxy-6-metoxy-1,4-benzoquinol methylase